jgi:ferredoxin
MRASVDPDKCQGHLRCALYAPEIFEVDDYGYAHVDVDVIPVELEAGTRQAAENCPEAAISITEG